VGVLEAFHAQDLHLGFQLVTHQIVRAALGPKLIVHARMTASAGKVDWLYYIGCLVSTLLDFPFVIDFEVDELVERVGHHQLQFKRLQNGRRGLVIIAFVTEPSFETTSPLTVIVVRCFQIILKYHIHHSFH
jgi:hypothetical protein